MAGVIAGTGHEFQVVAGGGADQEGMHIAEPPPETDRFLRVTETVETELLIPELSVPRLMTDG